MLKTILLATVALFTVSGAAHAATVDVLLGNTSNTENFSSGGAFSPNIDLTHFDGSLSLNNAAIFASNVSIPNYSAAPTGSLYGNEYVAVFGNPTGSATFTLASNVQSFGLTWGSIDSFNALTLTDSRGVTYTITGTQLMNYIASTPDAGSSQANVVITDPFARIVSAQLTSSSNSFEAANFSQRIAAVPLPGSVMLFGMALAGLGFAAYRNRRSV